MKDKKDKGYHKLLIWQKAKDLTKLIYKHTENFPKSEEFGLRSQIRRAIISVVLTIVEGHRRSSKKEFLHFLDISFGSLTEVEAAWELCFELGFIGKEAYEELDSKINEEAYLLNAFINSIKKQIKK